MKPLSFILVYLFLISNAFAQDLSTVLPDEPLYEAKLRIETAELNAKVDPLDKAALHTKHAETRLTEIQAMIATGKPEFVDNLAGDYEQNIKDANNDISRAQSQGKDVTNALVMVERATQKHTEVLTGLLDKVPEQAKPAIRRSIAVSRTGRNTAMDKLTNIRLNHSLNKNQGQVGMQDKYRRFESMENHGGFQNQDRMGRTGGIGNPGGTGGFGNSGGMGSGGRGNGKGP